MKVSVKKLKEELGENIVLTNDHFLLSSGRHSDSYINKDEVYTDPVFFDGCIAYKIARKFLYDAPLYANVIIGPESGGNKISICVAKILSKKYGRIVYSPQTRKTKDGNFYISGGEKHIPDVSVFNC